MIGHLKSDGLVECNRLLGAHGGAINAILAAAGHNLRLLVAWLRACFVRPSLGGSTPGRGAHPRQLQSRSAVRSLYPAQCPLGHRSRQGRLPSRQCCPRARSLPLLQRQPAAHCSREHASSKDLDLKRSPLQDGAAGRQINFEACLGPKSHLGSPRSTNSPYRPDDAHQISITGTQDGSDRPPMISRNRCGRRSAGRSGGWVGGRPG